MPNFFKKVVLTCGL